MLYLIPHDKLPPKVAGASENGAKDRHQLYIFQPLKDQSVVITPFQLWQLSRAQNNHAGHRP
jgi:hypothetical protein